MHHPPPLIGYRIKIILQVALIGSIFGVALGFITSLLDLLEPAKPMLRGLITGTIIGSNIVFFEEFVYYYKLRRKSYLQLLSMRTALYSFTLLFWLVIVNAVSLTIFEHASFGNAYNNFSTSN